MQDTRRDVGYGTRDTQGIRDMGRTQGTQDTGKDTGWTQGMWDERRGHRTQRGHRSRGTQDGHRGGSNPPQQLPPSPGYPTVPVSPEVPAVPCVLGIPLSAVSPELPVSPVSLTAGAGRGEVVGLGAWTSGAEAGGCRGPGDGSVWCPWAVTAKCNDLGDGDKALRRHRVSRLLCQLAGLG